MDEERSQDSRIIAIINFYLSKSGYVFKSVYTTIYDSFPKIGGIIQLIYYIFFGFNFLLNKYSIINDTRKLFFTLHNDEQINGGTQVKQFIKLVKESRQKYNKLIYPNKIFEKKIKNKKFDDKSSRNQIKFTKKSNNDDSSNSQNYDNSNPNNKSLSVFPFIFENVNQYSKNSDQIKNQNRKSRFCNEVQNMKKEVGENKSPKKNDSLIKKKTGENKEKKDKLSLNFYKNNVEKHISNFQILLRKYFEFKKKSFKYEQVEAKNVENDFSFIKYLYSFLCYNRQKYYYVILTRFRKKLLSEEHFFRTHNYLYLFEKCFDIQELRKIDVIELYKNL
jgi:hypothetical protein